VGREAICLLPFPLPLRLAFVFPGIGVGTQGFVVCVGGACCIQENFDKRDNVQREKVSKRDNFPCYLT
jgi:hypothetical protein